MSNKKRQDNGYTTQAAPGKQNQVNEERDKMNSMDNFTKTEAQTLFEKLCRGITWSQLSKREYWQIVAMESSDYLYHTHLITKFRRDEHGNIVFNTTTSGEQLLKANNESELKSWLRVQ